MTRNSTITVIDVCRALRIELIPAVTWAIGDRVRDLYYERTGKLPEKALRDKTNGPGSHCFAIYPTDWWPEIESVVREYQTEAARQMDLFA